MINDIDVMGGFVQISAESIFLIEIIDLLLPTVNGRELINGER